MTGIAREAFPGFGHEAGGDAELAAQGLDNVSEGLSEAREILMGLRQSPT